MQSKHEETPCLVLQSFFRCKVQNTTWKDLMSLPLLKVDSNNSYRREMQGNDTAMIIQHWHPVVLQRGHVCILCFLRNVAVRNRFLMHLFG